MHGAIALMVSDLAVLSSLRFALSIEGFTLAAEGEILSAAGLVIDQGSLAASLHFLDSLRVDGCQAPAIILTTHPTAAMRARAAAAGAAVIEKPLLGDDLSGAILAAIQPRKAA